MLRAVIKNTRILDGKSFIGMGLLGLVMNLRYNSDFKSAVIVVISLILYVAYAFAINNCFDVDTDLVNPRKRNKNPIASGELSFGIGILSSITIAILGILFAAFLGYKELLIYVSMILLATLYSAPPRLKAQPILDVISHGIFFGAMPFLYGAYFDGVLTKYEIAIGLALLFYSFSMELRNHLEDYESDLKANLRTTPIVIGKSLSEKLVMIFSGASIALLLVTLNIPLGVFGIMVAGIKVNYRTLDGIVVFLLALHALRTLLGA
ncbi:UbiA prenyltransferase family protein [Thermococcus paralvinellae]|uniref:4-hydroxybenzoate polyprenyltransferase n=1 Tax=Thermococcus paralvinellae TaxID=582419 RepID=W0I3T5_9EURY|nr:UbiA prenyltransferase family protein [Thermococcus paralvinellae]AHF80741.1 4-hydroxybenzoate polyprenyltransferase [Thermococcus paralvinellae]